MTRSQPRRTTKRIRLAPEVRSEKILDSALIEFSRHGFASTRIEDIARGAGLAKSGFYAHFESKEEVFEALLTRYLVTDEVISFEEGDAVADFIDKFIDFCYSRLVDLRCQAVLRLVLVETHRIPALVNRWRREVGDPAMEAQLKVLRAAVARKELAPDAILNHFQFAYAPMIHWVLANGFFDQEEASAKQELEVHRQLHRQMMFAFLRKPDPEQQDSCLKSGLSF